VTGLSSYPPKKFTRKLSLYPRGRFSTWSARRFRRSSHNCLPLLPSPMPSRTRGHLLGLPETTLQNQGSPSRSSGDPLQKQGPFARHLQNLIVQNDLRVRPCTNTNQGHFFVLSRISEGGSALIIRWLRDVTRYRGVSGVRSASLADADRVVSAISLDLRLAAVRKLQLRRLNVMLGRPPRWRQHRLQRLDVAAIGQQRSLITGKHHRFRRWQPKRFGFPIGTTA
jgi:hypothetical protein